VAGNTVYQSSNRPRGKIILATWLQTLLFTELLGAAIITSTGINKGINASKGGYNEAGVGVLLGAVFFLHIGGFGKFCVVILALSIVANDCPRIYWVSFTLMVMGRWIRHVSQFLWTMVASIAYIAIAISGYSSLEISHGNFMRFIGYRLVNYEGIGVNRARCL
jgi:purine-cytosine permease-like protein